MSRSAVRLRITSAERAMARSMALELSRTRLTVALVPGLTGRIRRAVESNPPWYRTLCSRYDSNRRDRARWGKWKTRIKRRETGWALEAIGRGQWAGIGVYGERVLAVVREEIAAERAREEFERLGWEATRRQRAMRALEEAV